MVWIKRWPGENSLGRLPPERRVNISSAIELRQSLRLQRDMRKAENGTSQEDVVNYYRNVAANMADLSLSFILDAPPYKGWREARSNDLLDKSVGFSLLFFK